MSADEEISGDLADMMANAQAASKPSLSQADHGCALVLIFQTYLPMRIYRANRPHTTLSK